MGKRHLLITGLPGTGKTTLLVRLAHLFADLHPCGFYTEEIRHEGVRVGFRLVGLDGSEGVLSRVDFRGPHRVGRYGVDVAGFERFLDHLDLPASPSPLVFMDEIGKMESLTPRFAGLVRGLLDSGKTVVATVALRGEGLIAEVKKRPDCNLVEVTPANRERLPGELAAWLRERVGQKQGDGFYDFPRGERKKLK